MRRYSITCARTVGSEGWKMAEKYAFSAVKCEPTFLTIGYRGPNLVLFCYDGEHSLGLCYGAIRSCGWGLITPYPL